MMKLMTSLNLQSSEYFVNPSRDKTLIALVKIFKLGLSVENLFYQGNNAEEIN